MGNRQDLREKLGRELTQAEYDAVVQTQRECSRLGDVPPAARLRAISEHATQMRPQLDKLIGTKQPMGVLVARAVGEVFSSTRHFFVDRIMSAERSYRATLLGVRHGVDAARLLREVARVDLDVKLVQFCDDLITQREELLVAAQESLSWFAAHSDIAMASGARVAASAR